MAIAAMARGLAGLVTSGSVRDRDAIAALGFPVFAKGVCIRGTDKFVPARFGRAVVIDGVQIEPGDWVLGDAAGVVVISRQHADDVLARAIEREALEQQVIERVRRGERTLDIYDLAATRASP
jgi:4-hydroxy-4-methyl-2-oxoglutarate aldolase